MLAVGAAVTPCAAGMANDDGGSSVVIVSPVAGWMGNKVEYTTPGAAAKSSLKENGSLFGIYSMYAGSALSFGTLGQFSALDFSREASYMFFAYYRYPTGNSLRPMVGGSLDLIEFTTRMPQSVLGPLLSMDLAAEIWAIHPMAGVSIGDRNLAVTPFVGYMNERVYMTMNVPGILAGPKVLPGFRQRMSAVADYVTVGTLVRAGFHHFVMWDGKAYMRIRSGERTLWTLRNRIDVFLSRAIGVSVKADYFMDDTETNYYIATGPAFAF